MPRYRVVFHIDEGTKSRCVMVLNNMRNLLAELGADAEVQLVANGEGVLMLLQKPSLCGEQVKSLMAQGVSFVTCAHSLQALGIDADTLLEGVKIVPSGVVELVRRQATGWAYIRP
ncbi:Hypothetical protein LUCI_3099 [Lucifera butyrica]|uniref:Uncharacterized protein n=1 Tax=Lucifera butyrica TaxID=1351585 RepID=A0A498R8J7_9FIRM|nr:DsrE family protein [Lucifera butyrica]VBB07834.1 Hypothetical protein LUCI_3099 [Lucifera butyrica]